MSHGDEREREETDGPLRPRIQRTGAPQISVPELPHDKVDGWGQRTTQANCNHLAGFESQT